MAADPVSLILDIGKNLIEKLLPDPKAKAEAFQKLQELQQSGDLAVIAGQNNINMVEASSKLTFVAGWRPFIGWVCGVGLGFQFVFAPLAVWGASLLGHPVPFPELDVSLLTTLMIGMLGLGGMRTVEKLQGVAST